LKFRLVSFVLFPVLALGQDLNVLSEAEKRTGWVLLFDGRSLDGWMWSVQSPAPDPSWTVENGLLRTSPERGMHTYLITRDSFKDFDFSFEWKTEAGSNSGIKYRFQGYWVPQTDPANTTAAIRSQSDFRSTPEDSKRIEPVALEYQIIDDERHPDAQTGPTHSTAALYEYWAPITNGPAKANVWHTARIVVRGLSIEHWLDGERVVRIELDSPQVQESFAKSRRRGSSSILAKQERRNSPIALQFHDGIVWFRNLKLRRY
jgi:hypothetical protein